MFIFTSTNLATMNSSPFSLLNCQKSVLGMFPRINLYSKIISPVSELHRWVNPSMCKYHRLSPYLCRSSNSTRPLPMLMLPKYNSLTANFHGHYFFDICNNNIYTFRLRDFRWPWQCCGSSEGWLIYMDLYSFRICLFDPLSKAEKHLPPIDALADVEPGESNGNPYISFDFKNKLKIVLSSDPNSSHGYVVMAIVFQKLFFFRHDDKNWTLLTTPYDPYQDVIWYKDMFYAVSCTGPVISFDVMANPFKVREISQGMPEYKDELLKVEHFLDLEFVCVKYLVESLGELLYVERIVKRERNAEKVYRTTHFHVCKVDQVSGTLAMVRSLGDQMLFLGHNRSLSLSVYDYPELECGIGLRRNCIFFTDDFAEAYHKSSQRFYDMGFFSLESGSLNPIVLRGLFWPHQTILVMINMPPAAEKVSQMNVEGQSNPSKPACFNKFKFPFVI